MYKYFEKLQKISKKELQEFIDNTLLNFSDSQNNVSIDVTINNLIKNYSLQKTPLYKTILLNLILSIIFFFLTPYLQKVNIKMFKNPKPLVKVIKKKANKLNISREQVKDLKFVTASVLNVRLSDSNKCRIIGKLYAGQIVRILYKKRVWTLVEFINDDVEIKGWVFSRYLSRIK